MTDTVDKAEAEVFHPRPDGRKLTAGDDIALIIHDADRSVDGVFHLNNNVLKNSARHNAFSILPLSR